MKILFVLPEYPPYFGGGIASFYANILAELVGLDNQVDVLVGSAFTSNLSSYKSSGVNVNFLSEDLVKLYHTQFTYYQPFPELQKHLAAAWAIWQQTNGGQGYDLVEVTDWGLLFVPWIVNQDSSPPTVVRLHGSIGQIDYYDPKLDSLMQGHLVRLLESGLLSSAEELSTHSSINIRYWQNITNRSVSYIPPPLPCTSSIQSRNYSSNGLVVGRIQYWKGVTVLSEALEQMGDQAPVVDWIGRDTAYRNSQTSMSDYLSQYYPNIWGGKIKPMGTFSPDKTRQVQANAKFIIVPSIWDVFNFTCVEGMAQGKVVLCSDSAGAVDLITHGVNGLIFKGNDPNSLVESLNTVMSWNNAQLQEVGQNARETVGKLLDPSLVAKQYIESYQNLIERGRKPIKPNQWLIDAVSPQEELGQPLAFLDNLPLKDLSRYTINRFIKKISNKLL
ncbi:glycosyltransferase family 4 protein [Nodularia spumigena]|uniref:glycosyltransferase family 4 protein n=1 Tax=Nodularia spumigena TaxID=70799 RepID=UPI00232DE158|nr:glycosyltransferase family 4 protein [Nodularia spumigena]MDB9347425.1 glycosyltransferase family 4 protein [Nodularia spumigena CS-588/01]MDB9354471.1 glycosyltransferase family 4 protein [Nodularia spumigena CS-588/05]